MMSKFVYSHQGSIDEGRTTDFAVKFDYIVDNSVHM